MFKADLTPMAAVIEDLRKIPRQINGCVDELSQAAVALGELSYLDGPLRELRAAGERLDRQGAQMMQMQRALETVREQYRRSEQEVIDYCEETSVLVHREPAAYYRLDWVSELLNL